MLKTSLVIALLSFSTAALATDAPDMSKMGPWTRPVKMKDEKGIDALYKSAEEAIKKQDVEGSAALHDFPVIMVTDNSKGEVSAAPWTKEMFVNEMTPMFAAPMPKEMKHECKRQVHFLSETLAVVVENHKQTMGKQSSSWVASSTVVNKDGKWLFKSAAEAGWGGDMKTAAAKNEPAPAKK